MRPIIVSAIRGKGLDRVNHATHEEIIIPSPNDYNSTYPAWLVLGSRRDHVS